MSSLDKMLGLLDLFTVERPVWSSEELIAHLAAPASTCYRYLKALHSTGYLARVANGSYVLGPRIMELDRVSRRSDPVYVAGSAVAQRLALETGHSSLLCMLFSDSLMCVQQSRGRDVPDRLFDRGQRRPLLAGASAKCVVAQLPMHQLRILYARQRDAVGMLGLGMDWEEFKAELRKIRQAGYSMTVGDYNAGIVSVAAPVFNRAGEVLGSLALAASVDKIARDAFEAYAPAVVQAAQEITAHICSDDARATLPARALVS
jgi:DNA-binding IclR family transcriptional regulator